MKNALWGKRTRYDLVRECAVWMIGIRRETGRETVR